MSAIRQLTKYNYYFEPNETLDTDEINFSSLTTENDVSCCKP
jgi:hypothetical protein